MKAPRILSTAKARLIGCAVAGLASLIAVAVPPALASHVTCGQTITEDTKLDSDLTCTGDGIVIGAPNITLNLNGHTITGDDGSGDVGVDNSAGHAGVEVKNGTIEDFDDGVFLRGATENRLHELVLSENFGGIVLSRSDGNSVKENEASGNPTEGIRLEDDSDGNSVKENEASGSSAGIFLVGSSDGNSVKGNALSGNGAGIRLFDSYDNSFVENEASGNSSVGILVHFNSSGSLLLQNRADGNGGDGIEVQNANTTITKNTANDNADLGIEAVPGVTDGGGNKAKGNGNPLQCTGVSCK